MDWPEEETSGASEVEMPPEMSWPSIPDDLWRRILEVGVKSSTLSHRDLCCLSISCKFFYRYADEDSLWIPILSSHFPEASNSSLPAKAAFKFKYEIRTSKLALKHYRELLRKEGQVRELELSHKNLVNQVEIENTNLKLSMEQLNYLKRVRQVSAAMNVWQPQVVRDRHREIVEQCLVPVESRIHSLEMEVKLWNVKIFGLKKSLTSEWNKLELAREELASLRCLHPMHKHLNGEVTSQYWEQMVPGRKRKCHP